MPRTARKVTKWDLEQMKSEITLGDKITKLRLLSFLSILRWQISLEENNDDGKS